MNIGYIYNLHAFPPKGGNHRHVYELVNGFVSTGNKVFVVDDPTMPNVTNIDSSASSLRKFIQSIDVLYIRIDGRFTHKWPAMNQCMKMINDLPVVWEINAPANETLAFSWLGGGMNLLNDEGLARRIKRQLHAFRKYPSIFLEERHRSRLAAKVKATINVSTALSLYSRETLGVIDSIVQPNGGPLISENEIARRRGFRSSNKFTVLYSGSAIYPWQGLDYLKKVIEISHEENSGIHFKLLVNQYVEDLPRFQNVEIMVGVDRENLLNEVCCADLCVALHPEYFWSKYGFHGSPMKLFEYMACMTPTLSSNIGQMKEIIKDGVDGFLVDNDPVKIHEKIRLIKSNEKLRTSVGRNGWEMIQKKYNWANVVNKTLDVFNSVL